MQSFFPLQNSLAIVEWQSIKDKPAQIKLVVSFLKRKKSFGKGLILE